MNEAMDDVSGGGCGCVYGLKTFEVWLKSLGDRKRGQFRVSVRISFVFQ